MILHGYRKARRQGGGYRKDKMDMGGEHGKDKMDMERTPERACATPKNKMDMGRTPERACATLKNTLDLCYAKE